MQLVVDSTGQIRAVYDEAVDLRSLGAAKLDRASHVEPNRLGEWLADLKPVDGPILGPFERRSEALVAECEWLEVHWLPSRRS